MTETTPAQAEQIVAFCRGHRVRRLTWLQEPVRAGPDAGAAALMIEFDCANLPSLARLAAMEDEISRILGRRTDLHLYLRELHLGQGPGEAGIAYDRADYLDIALPQDKIAEFCRRHKIKRLYRHKRPLRDSVIADNDVDFTVEFLPDCGASLLERFNMEEKLGDILGCAAGLHPIGDVFPVENWRERWPAELQYEHAE